MDTTDPDIKIDEEGVCSHCRRYGQLVSAETYLRKKRPGALDNFIAAVKNAGRNKRYDCIIGVSGGVDSTYVAYKVKEFGLRPLAVHLDNGWNSELAASNIEKMLKKLVVDLYTHVLDWDEFRDIQLAFLKASTPDCEIPTDHAILAVLYKTAADENVRFILSGHNTASEGGGVPAWSQGHGDWLYIKSIHDGYGTIPIKSYAHYGLLDFAYYTMVKGIRWVPILDYLDYDKKAAMKVLEEKLEWKNYGSKHYESIYTRFHMGYLLPKKFGYEYKRLHLSSLVWSAQLSRQAAIEEMDKEDYPAAIQEQDREYIIKKFGITPGEFEKIMLTPPKSFWDFPSYKKLLGGITPFLKFYHSLKRN